MPKYSFEWKLSGTYEIEEDNAIDAADTMREVLYEWGGSWAREDAQVHLVKVQE